MLVKMQTPLGALVPSRHSYLQSFLSFGGHSAEEMGVAFWLETLPAGKCLQLRGPLSPQSVLCRVRCCHYVGSAGFAPARGCPWYLAVKFRRRKKPQISLFSFSCLLNLNTDRICLHTNTVQECTFIHSNFHFPGKA